MSETDGNGCWRQSSRWPSPEVVNQIWHLAGNRLAPAPQTDAAPPATRFTGDTQKGMSLQGDPVDFVPCPALTPDGVPTAFSSGTAVFSLPPLPHALEILGIPRLVLWITCSRCDAALSARLTVQIPPQKCGEMASPTAFSTGICRMALRCDPQIPLINDATDIPVALNLELQPVALHIPAGAILRLEIGSGESPRFLPKLLSSNFKGRRCEIAIWHAPRYPSRLILPVLNKDPPTSAPIA